MAANIFHHFCLFFLFLVLAKSVNFSSSSSTSSSSTSTTSTPSIPSSPSPSSTPSPIIANSTSPSSNNSDPPIPSSSTPNPSTTITSMGNGTKMPSLNDSADSSPANGTSSTMPAANLVANSSTTPSPCSMANFSMDSAQNSSAPANSSTIASNSSSSDSPSSSTPIPASSTITNSAAPNSSTISHLVARSPIHLSSSTNSSNQNKNSSNDGSDEEELVQRNGKVGHDALMERPISGEDVSGNEDGMAMEEGNTGNGQQNDGENGQGDQWNGTTEGRGELPLLPAHFVLPVQKHGLLGKNNISHGMASNHSKLNNSGIEAAAADFPFLSSASESNGTTINDGKEGTNRSKRDYISDAVNKMNEAMGNAQSQMAADGSSSSSLSNVNNLAAQPPQIISIPPIDLSGKTQNIILVSDTGNVTLRRGNGFLSVETMMVQQPQQSPKN